MGAGGAVAHSHAVAAGSAVMRGHGWRRRSCNRATSRSRIVLVVIHGAHGADGRLEWNPLVLILVVAVMRVVVEYDGNRLKSVLVVGGWLNGCELSLGRERDER